MYAHRSCNSSPSFRREDREQRTAEVEEEGHRAKHACANEGFSRDGAQRHWDLGSRVARQQRRVHRRARRQRRALVHVHGQGEGESKLRRTVVAARTTSPPRATCRTCRIAVSTLFFLIPEQWYVTTNASSESLGCMRSSSSSWIIVLVLPSAPSWGTPAPGHGCSRLARRCSSAAAPSAPARLHTTWHAPSRSRRPPAGARMSSARAAAGRRSRACGPGSAAGRPPRPRSRAGSAGRTRTRPWMRGNLRMCGARAAPPAVCIPAGRMVRGSPFVHGVTDRRCHPRGCGWAPSRRAARRSGRYIGRRWRCARAGGRAS
jgi:hypothetical protein